MPIDLNVTQNQYDTMMSVLNGIRSKLAAAKPELTRALATENGQVKIKEFTINQNPGWLREVKQMRDDLNKYFEDIGWRD